MGFEHRHGVSGQTVACQSVCLSDLVVDGFPGVGATVWNICYWKEKGDQF